MITSESKQVFFSTFYDTFLNSDPEIKAMFANTELDRQITMLKNAISMAILYVEKQDDLAIDVLTRIQRSHARSRLGVKPEYYTIWLNSLISTLRKCDSQFTGQLENDWREMMQVAIDYIVSGYEQ